MSLTTCEVVEKKFPEMGIKGGEDQDTEFHTYADVRFSMTSHVRRVTATGVSSTP